MLSGTAHTRQINAYFACETADGGACGDDIFRWLARNRRSRGSDSSRGGNWFSRSRGGNRCRCCGSHSHRCWRGHGCWRRCRSWWGNRCGCRRGWSRCRRSCWFASRCCGSRRFDRPDRLAYLDRFPFFDRYAQDFPSKWTGDRHGRLVGLELEQGLLELDYIANLDVDLQDIAGFNTFAQAWQFDFCSHGWLCVLLSREMIEQLSC